MFRGQRKGKQFTSSSFFFFIVSLAVDVIFQIKILCKCPVTKLLQAHKSLALKVNVQNSFLQICSKKWTKGHGTYPNPQC